MAKYPLFDSGNPELAEECSEQFGSVKPLNSEYELVMEFRGSKGWEIQDYFSVADYEHAIETLQLNMEEMFADKTNELDGWRLELKRKSVCKDSRCNSRGICCC